MRKISLLQAAVTSGLAAMVVLSASVAPVAAAAAAAGTPPRPPSNGNPGTFSTLAVRGTVTVSTLPNAIPTAQGEGRGAGHVLPSARRAPAGPASAPPSHILTLPNVPTIANSLEQEINFAGLPADGFAPPDTQVARGGNDVVEETNLNARISTRSGAPIKTFSLSSFYAGVTSIQLSDPRIVFDDNSGRWFTTIITAPASQMQNSVFAAVSSSSDPTGLWTIYKVEGPVPFNRFADQARLGFSSDKIVIAFEDFDVSGGCFPASSCHNDIVWVLELADMIAGVKTHATRFNTTSGLAHPFGVVPAIPLASAETTTAYAAYNETHAFGHNAAVLVITGLPSAGTTAYSDIETGIMGTNGPPPAHQPGGHQNIDTGDDRFLSASVGEALGGLGAEIWISAGDKCNAGGVAQACIRGLAVEVDSTGTTLSKAWEREIGATGFDLYYPAIVGSASGTHAFLTFTISSDTVFPTSEVLSIFPSQSSQNAIITYAAGTQPYLLGVDPTHNNLSRWGDYSGIYPDDATGTNVWVATEFGAVSGGDWSTEVAQYTIAPPVVTSVSPSSGVAGTRVGVFGANFTNTSLVAFGGTPAASFEFAGSDELIVTAPPQAAGTVDVTVTTLKGTSAITPVDHYTYPAILWTSLPGDHAVTMIDTSNGSLITPPFSISGGTGTSEGIGTLPDDSEALVVDAANGVVVPIITLTRALGPSVPVGPSPLDIAVRPDGAIAYVTRPKALVPLKIGAGGALKKLTPINVPGANTLTGIAITSDSTRAYVTDPPEGKVWVIALTPNGGGGVIGQVSMDFPTGIAVNGSVAYVTIDLGPSAGGLVLTIDTGTNTILDSVPVGRDPRRVIVNPAGDYAYVSNTGDATITAIHHLGPGSDSVAGVFPVGPGPIGLAMVPNGSTGFAALSTAGNIGSFTSPPPPVLNSFPSGGSDPEQLAIATPSPVICQSNGVTKLLLAVTPANAVGGSPFDEIDHLGFCPAGTATLTVTVKSTFSVVPSGCTKPPAASATWTLNPGANSHFAQRLAPACTGSYTLRVQIFGPGNVLLTSAIAALVVS